MNQYSNWPDPTESAARKERLRYAEEQGEIEEAATCLVGNSLEAQRMETSDPVESTPERIPALQRFGAVSETQSALKRLGPGPENQDTELLPKSLQLNRKTKTKRTTLQRSTPLSLTMMGAGIRKRRVTKAAPSPQLRGGGKLQNQSLRMRRTHPGKYLLRQGQARQ